MGTNTAAVHAIVIAIVPRDERSLSKLSEVQLTPEIADWISNADTFFVASAYPDGPVDASHRGGKPGFVALTSGSLRIPDYPGNSMFGTFHRLYLLALPYSAKKQLERAK